jgi:biotin transport system substrate-specific component
MRSSVSLRVEPTLADVLWPSTAATRDLLLAAVGTVFLALSAKLQIPFWPVPMTMQTYVVLVLGMVHGPRLGTTTMALYLVEGALGLPVFAGTPQQGIGVSYMLGPTGGYLAGFVLGAALSGALAQRGWDRTPGRSFLAMALAHVAIFIPGVSWLAMHIGWERAIAAGLTPFWAATLAKTALGVITLPLAWRVVGRHLPRRARPSSG